MVDILKYALAKFFGLYVRNVYGRENLPRKGGFIITANHASYMDHLVMSSVIIPYNKKVINFLAKKEHFEGFQRFWHRWVGAIPIDRQTGGKEALKMSIKWLRKGAIMGIYPEGTRTLTGRVQRGKTGAVRLALAAKVPIVPVGLKGTFEILPKGKNIPKFRRCIIKIGKPIYLDKYYGKQNNKKVLRFVTDNIMKEITKLAGQGYGH